MDRELQEAFKETRTQINRLDTKIGKLIETDSHEHNEMFQRISAYEVMVNTLNQDLSDHKKDHPWPSFVTRNLNLMTFIIALTGIIIAAIVAWKWWHGT